MSIVAGTFPGTAEPQRGSSGRASMPPRWGSAVPNSSFLLICRPAGATANRLLLTSYSTVAHDSHPAYFPRPHRAGRRYRRVGPTHCPPPAAAGCRRAGAGAPRKPPLRRGRIAAAARGRRSRRDYNDVADLTRACQGAACVVSALSGLRPVIVEAQTRLLAAAVAAGGPRFIPSDYSADFTRLPAGSNRNFDLRREFQRRLDAAPISGPRPSSTACSWTYSPARPR